MAGLRFALDSETGLIANGLLAPPPVCMSTFDGRTPDLIPSFDGWRYQVQWLGDVGLRGELVGFNVAFDLAVAIEWLGPVVAELVFRAYAEGRVHDIQIAERLGQIAHGEPAQMKDSLATVARRYHVDTLVTEGKSDGTRTSYGPLLFAPLSSYSRQHVDYAIGDAVTTWHAYERSRGRYRDVTHEAISQESTHAFWLHLVSAWGLRTDPHRVADLRREALAKQAELRAIARREGLIGSNGKKDTQRLTQVVAEAYGIPGRWHAGTPNRNRTPVKWLPDVDAIPKRLRTKKGGLSTSKVVKADSNHPVLTLLEEIGTVDSVVGMLPSLEEGTRSPIHSRYRLANTTRTTSSGDDDTVGGKNSQNEARNLGDLPYLRVRECAEPRPGMVFGDVDVSGLEHGTFAQVLGWTCNRWDLARKLNEGIDLHCELAANHLLPGNLTWQQVKKGAKVKGSPEAEARQFAKIPGFGKLGGQGAESLVRYARQQGIHMTLERAQELDRAWKHDNPDAVFYQQVYIRSLLRPCPTHGMRKPRGVECPTCGRHDFLIPGSPGIWRRNVSFTSACNGHFQALGAQVMKRIGWALTLEAWTRTDSVLHISRGARMNNFIHDAFGYEMPRGSEHDVLTRVCDVMLDGLRIGLPNVKMGVEPCAMTVNSKRAELVRDSNGRIQAWEP